jgi:hypothetical protein
MARKAIPRIKRPSGIEVSANGNYYYWNCNVSGLETFAPEARFKEVVAKYGSEEKLFKTYVLRPVQKYVDAGFDADYIKKLIVANDGKLPSMDGKAKERKQALKKPRKQRLKKFAVGEVVIHQTNDTGSLEEVKQKVYPWTGNPDYFKSEPVPFDAALESGDTCFYPNRNLTDMCYGCAIYDKCKCHLKMGEADWKNPKKRTETKVKALNCWDE